MTRRTVAARTRQSFPLAFPQSCPWAVPPASPRRSPLLFGRLLCARVGGYRRGLLQSTALSPRRLAPTLTVVAFVLVLASPVLANPSGGQVVGGQATIAATDPKTLQVVQSSAKAIIEWQSFSIGADETTRFVQPSSSSIALNRVTGGDPSRILGALSANGQIMLINGSGILFGATAKVDVAGLVASTADIRNDDFMAGRMNFDIPGRADAAIVNRGEITVADSGLVAMVAPGVENAGRINAKFGRVALASGERFAIDLYGDGLVSLAVGASQPASDADGRRLDAAVSNSGGIFADGGLVTLSAATASAIVDNVINNDGFVQARRIDGRGGEIRLDGGDFGSVRVAGNLDASSDDGRGGSIKVLGAQVALADGAALDASGATGGGTILAGGDWQGQGAERTARATRVAAGATLKADARQSGDGGTVVVWADGATQFSGAISARGGAAGGNGGKVEVSGKQSLGFAGTVDTHAPNGQTGSLLLDPVHAVISGDADGTSGDTETINAATLVANLNSTNVTVSADQSITVNASVNASAQSNGNTLHFDDADGGGLTTNLNAVITLGANQHLTGEATTVNVGSGGRIQNGIDVAASGGAVNVAAGSYAEALTIGKALTLDGAGAGQTIIDPAGASGIGIAVSGNIGADAAVTISDLTVQGAGTGIRVADNTTLGTIALDGLVVRDNGSQGFISSNGGSNPTSVANINILNSVFEGNGFGGGNGSADINLFRFNGTATLDNVDILGTNGSPATLADYGLQIRGHGEVVDMTEAGTVTLNGVRISGAYEKAHLAIQRYSDAANIALADVVLGGALSAGTGDGAASVAASAAGWSAFFASDMAGDLSFGDTLFAGGTFGYGDIRLGGSTTGFRVDAADTVFSGISRTGAAGAENFAIEDRVEHALDDAAVGGLVVWETGHLYVTSDSGSIQRGIDAANAANTVHVGTGSYAESLTIDKTLTLDGAGVGQTVLDAATHWSGTGILVNDAMNVTISDLTITDYQHGVKVVGTSSDMTVERVAFNDSKYGLSVGTGSSAVARADDFHMIDSTFSDGMIAVQTYNNTANGGSFADALFENVSIDGATYKGFYFETADNLTLRDVTITDTGNVGGSDASQFHKYGHAVDLNLKYAAYDSITFDNLMIENSGHSSGDASGAAVAVKTRGTPGDSTTYVANPASLESLTIIGGNISGSAGTGLRVEDLRTNTGGLPTVTITGGLQFANNGQDIVVNGANVDATGAVFVGAADGFAIEDRVAHAMDTVGRGLVTWDAGALYVTENTLGIQRGIDVADAGNRVNVAAGSYAAGVTVDKAGLTLSGAAGARMDIAAGQTGVTVAANDVTVEGLEIAGPHAGTAFTAVDWAAVESASGNTTGVLVNANVTGATIQDNDIHDIRTGVAYFANTTGTVTGNRIENTKGAILLRADDTEISASGIAVSGNSEGPVGNEWGLVYNLHHLIAAGDTTSEASASRQTFLLASSQTNGGMSVLDRGYARSNRTHVFVDDGATATAADDFNRGNALGNANQALGTLQAGVNALVSGGTVKVAGGTYDEDVAAGKSFTLDNSAAATSVGLSGSWIIGGDVSFAGAVALAGDLALDTSAVDGDVAFLGAVSGRGAGGQDLTIDAGDGTVTMHNLGTASVKLGDVAVTAGAYAGAAGTAYVANFDVEADEVAVGNSTVNATGNVSLSGTNISGSIVAATATVAATGNVTSNIAATNSANVSGANVQGAVSAANVTVAATQTANATVVATNTASVSGANVQGSVSGANVTVAATQTANTTVVATNTASVSAANVQGSVQAPTASVTASQSVDIQVETNNLTVSAGSGQVSGNAGTVHVAGGVIEVNDEATTSVDSGVGRGSNVLDPSGAAGVEIAVPAAMSPSSLAFAGGAGDVFAYSFGLGLAPAGLQPAAGGDSAPGESGDANEVPAADSGDVFVTAFFGDFWSYFLGNGASGGNRDE